MFEIEKLDVEVPNILAPREELRSIVDEYSLGIAVREVALFRVWRLWKDDLYTSIYNDDEGASQTSPAFSSDGEFIQFLVKRLNVARSKIYTRLRTYSLLEFLGYVDKEIVTRMARKPGLYERALNLIFNWDMTDRVVVDLKTKAFGESPFEEDTRSNIRIFLDELENADSISDALQILEEDVLEKRKIKIKYDYEGDVFSISYKDDDVDTSTGITIMGDEDVVEFYPNHQIPQWVRDELNRRFGPKE